MRRACYLTASVTTLVLMAAPASAQPDPATRDCSSFASQAEAQVVYDEAVRTDNAAELRSPERLDPDGDGIVCEPGEAELPFTGARENVLLAVSGSALLAGGAALACAGRRQRS